MMSEMDVNAIAGTLKLYFRELPEPLFTDEFYPNFAEGIGEHWRPPPVYHRPCFSPNFAGGRGTENLAGPRRPLPILTGPPRVPIPPEYIKRVKQPVPLWTHWGVGSLRLLPPHWSAHPVPLTPGPSPIK